MYGFDAINDATGFANGTPFRNASDVRRYFTVEAQREMFSDDVGSQDVLSEMAAEVIAKHWHMLQQGKTE